MNANQKREYIKNHCTAVMEEVLSKVDKMLKSGMRLSCGSTFLTSPTPHGGC